MFKPKMSGSFRARINQSACNYPYGNIKMWFIESQFLKLIIQFKFLDGLIDYMGSPDLTDQCQWSVSVFQHQPSGTVTVHCHCSLSLFTVTVHCQRIIFLAYAVARVSISSEQSNKCFCPEMISSMRLASSFQCFSGSGKSTPRLRTSICLGPRSVRTDSTILYV